MSLKEKLTADMKTAMKARETERLTTIRMVLAALKNAEIDNREALDEAGELQLLAREAKKRRESIGAYEEAGRQDLAQKEAAELAIIETYLPRQLSEAEARDIVAEVVAETGATSARDIGKVMKELMPRLKGRFPGKQVKSLVDDALSSAS